MDNFLPIVNAFLYYFTQVEITKYYREGGIKIDLRFLIELQAGSPTLSASRAGFSGSLSPWSAGGYLLSTSSLGL